MNTPIRLAAFDLDGTVLEHNGSWAAIHKHFGTEHQSEASLRLYTEGKIDYREFMRRDIGSWPKGVTEDEIRGILSGYRIRREAPEVFGELKSRGVKTALVSAGIDMLAEEVARELGIDHWLANGLKFGRNGVLLSEGVGRVDPTRKDVAFRRLLGEIGVPADRSIAVGDTMYDLSFLKSARLGFMLAHTTRVSDPGIINIDKLTDIFSHL